MGNLSDMPVGSALAFAPLTDSSLHSLGAADRERNGSKPADRERNGKAPYAVGGSPPGRESPVSGPPPAPAPRVFEWELNGTSGDRKSRKVGMGDLLAGALAAFHESYHSVDDVEMTGPLPVDSGPLPVDAGTSRDGVNQRDFPGRRAPGLQLAPPVDRNVGNAAEALTDPELRLPDLTAEPLWRPPGTGRKSAAGD